VPGEQECHEVVDQPIVRHGKAALGFAGGQENPQQFLCRALGPLALEYIAHDPSQLGCRPARPSLG
jgi:hypothetical protein